MVDGQEWPKGETPAVSTWPRNKAGRLRPIVPITGQKIDMQLNTSLACRRDCHLTDRSKETLGRLRPSVWKDAGQTAGRSGPTMRGGARP